MEAAKTNGLNTYSYINHLLLYIPDAGYMNDPEVLEELMPWSELVKGECKLYIDLLGTGLLLAPVLYYFL